ncbi:unnamed protein product [Ectocarpus sp. 12 AP-2014]
MAGIIPCIFRPSTCRHINFGDIANTYAIVHSTFRSSARTQTVLTLVVYVPCVPDASVQVLFFIVDAPVGIAAEELPTVPPVVLAFKDQTRKGVSSPSPLCFRVVKKLGAILKCDIVSLRRGSNPRPRA